MAKKEEPKDEIDVTSKYEKRSLWIAFAVFLIALVLTFKVDYFFSPGDDELTKIGTFEYVENDIRQRHSTSLAFKPGRISRKVFNHDRIFSGEGSQATMKFSEGFKLEVLEKSLITLNFAEEKTVKLEKGNIKADLKKGEDLSLEVGGQTAKIQGNDSRIKVSSQLGKGFKIELESGEPVNMTFGNRVFKLKSGQDLEFDESGSLKQPVAEKAPTPENGKQQAEKKEGKGSGKGETPQQAESAPPPMENKTTGLYKRPVANEDFYFDTSITKLSPDKMPSVVPYPRSGTVFLHKGKGEIVILLGKNCPSICEVSVTKGKNLLFRRKFIKNQLPLTLLKLKKASIGKLDWHLKIDDKLVKSDHFIIKEFTDAAFEQAMLGDFDVEIIDETK